MRHVHPYTLCCSSRSSVSQNTSGSYRCPSNYAIHPSMLPNIPLIYPYIDLFILILHPFPHLPADFSESEMYKCVCVFRVCCIRRNLSIQIITCCLCVCSIYDPSPPSTVTSSSTTRTSSHTPENTHTTCARTSRTGWHTHARNSAGQSIIVSLLYCDVCVRSVQLSVCCVSN